jgi:2,3-bisphosphoglycerate-independent phosphoglycerate mutase
MRLVNGENMSTRHSPRGATALAEGVRALYAEGQTDYSLEPLVLVDDANNPLGRVQDGDAVIFCCRRGEREVELTEAFTEAGFSHFSRPDFQNLDFVILTLYHEKFKDLPVAFAPSKIKDTLAEVVSQAGLRQLHTSESEKFTHVTFFFNGGNNQPFAGEDDIRIPSPRGVPFEEVPELSLAKVAEEVMRGIEKKYDLIVANFANGDVIGHTANNDAKIHCAEFVDHWLGEVIDKAQAAGYVSFITADHGNLEEMITPNGAPHVAHTTNPVPLILIDPVSSSVINLCDGKLADLAPTVLSALGLSQPSCMEGITLTLDHVWGGQRRVLLIILDGWGIGKHDGTNPIHLAHTLVWDGLIERYSSSNLQASGDMVGLKSGKAGNSEAGHINIGAGRVVLQDDVRLDEAMKDGSFNTNEVFIQTINSVIQRGKNLHLLGLLTEKSSHGTIDYPLAILKLAKDRGLENVYLHVIFDGRSTEPGSAPVLLEKLEAQVDEIGIGQVVTGVGRGIALDRDGNYGKIKLAYEAFVNGTGKACILRR